MSLYFPETSSQNPVDWIKHVPIAHRGFHDEALGIYENTLSATKRAVDNGYAIEVDLQPSADGVAMVFHDYSLERMCGVSEQIRDTSLSDLQKLKIKETDETIPTLKELLEQVAGKTGLVLELKGQAGNDEGFVEAVAADLNTYQGDVAIMSFHHHILDTAREIAPTLPLGLTAEGDNGLFEIHRSVSQRCNVDFISYELANLDCDFVKAFTDHHRPAICWTVRSKQEAEKSAVYVDQITFEGFHA